VAIYNEILVGRFARGVQKLFSMKGGPPLRQLAGELSVTHNLLSGVENRYLEGWERYAASFGPTGGAGQSAGIRLRNPPAQNVMVVIEQVIMWSPANFNISVQRLTSNADLTTVVALTGNRVPDARQQRPNPTAIASTDTNAATTGLTLMSVAGLANTTFLLMNDSNHEIPVTPGELVQLFSNVVATQINCTFLWRERFLEDSERT
jgi:hypothetical protein